MGKPESVLGLQNAPDYFDDAKEKNKVKKFLTNFFPKTRQTDTINYKTFGMSPE
jgi:hypothetical protein